MISAKTYQDGATVTRCGNSFLLTGIKYNFTNVVAAIALNPKRCVKPTNRHAF